MQLPDISRRAAQSNPPLTARTSEWQARVHAVPIRGTSAHRDGAGALLAALASETAPGAFIGAPTLRQALTPPTHLVSDLASPAGHQGWFRAFSNTRSCCPALPRLDSDPPASFGPSPSHQSVRLSILSLHRINPFSTLLHRAVRTCICTTSALSIRRSCLQPRRLGAADTRHIFLPISEPSPPYTPIWRLP